MAIPVAAIVAARLGGRRAGTEGLVAVGLCAVVFWPGVVEQSDLDARAVNAVAAAGVLLAAALTITGLRRFGGSSPRADHLDTARVLLIAIALLVLAVPWLAAMVGISFAGVAVLGSIWQTDELRVQPGHELLSPAVHAGHHHGLDGVLLALSALALSRMRVTRLRIAVGAYLALVLAYGLANAVQDAWLEDVVKAAGRRGRSRASSCPRDPRLGGHRDRRGSRSSPWALRRRLGLGADRGRGRLAAPLAAARAAARALLLRRLGLRLVASRRRLGAEVGGG